MLSLERQEAYRRRYALLRPGWRPSSHVYQEMVAAHLDPAVRVLDVGCGRGGVMERLHTLAGLVVGIDPDLSSLQGHRTPAMYLTCGLAGVLPYSDGSFDVACCSWVLEHVASPARMFAEVRRVLAPGGTFVFLTPSSLNPLLGLNRCLQWTGGRLVQRVYGRSEADIFRSYYRANTIPRLKRLMSDAGLRIVRLQPVGDPSYLAFSEVLFRLASLVDRLIPSVMRVHIVGECVAV